MNRDGRSCATCVKAHLASETLAGPNLECRAGPPVQDVARHARFPLVRPDHYCHDKYERDAELGALVETSHDHA